MRRVFPSYAMRIGVLAAIVASRSMVVKKSGLMTVVFGSTKPHAATSISPWLVLAYEFLLFTHFIIA